MSSEPATAAALGPVTGYRPLPAVYDEMIDGEGRAREPWSHVGRLIDGLGVPELARRRGEAARLLTNDGVQYQPSPADPGAASEVRAPQRWELDPVPVMLGSGQWAELELGVIQRAELLSLILADLYGRRLLLRSGLIPPELVYDHPSFLREADQILIPGSQLPLCAVDLARDAGGSWWALTDRAQTPSGFGYALENRVVVSRVFPSMYRNVQAHRLAPFFRTLRSALRAAAPRGVDEPQIVVLTPGPWSETAFEHAFLASYLGYALVEGADLTVRGGRVWLRSLGQLEAVDVILRRVDSSYCDPLELRSESLLGVPGLLETCRLGTVSVVNPIGSGVLENPSLLPLLPRLCQHMLGQSLRLPSVPTWWCGEPDDQRYVLAHLEQLVVKTTSREPDAQTLLGWELSAAKRDELRRRIEARPHSWVGQQPLELSTVPAFTDRGLEPQHMLMRTYLVARGESYTAMPGALARIAPTTRGALINRGAGHRAVYKDVWVAASEPEELTGFWLRSDQPIEAEPAAELLPTSRAAENLFWFGRYAERAESLVRLLRVVEDRTNDFADGMTPAGNACLRTLRDALAEVSGGDATSDDDHSRVDAQLEAELQALITNPARPGGLAYAVRRLRDAAYRVRDQLSADTWLVFSALERELLGPAGGAAEQAPGRLARVLSSLLALGGLTAESMTRDQGWRFMNVGRRLERALQMLGLLRSTVTVAHDTATDSLVLESVLTAAESIITYRRRYRSHAQLDTLLDLLLLAPDNPRSVAYQLELLTVDVTAVARRDAAGRLTHAERLVLEASTALRLADLCPLGRVDELPDAAASVASGDGQVRSRPELAAFLEHLTALLKRSADAVDAEHFAHPLPQRPLPPADTGHGIYLRLV